MESDQKSIGVMNVHKASVLKLSVAVCTYNGEKYIEEQIQSILNQKRLPDEIVISDDNSCDDTLAVADHLLSSFGVIYKIIKNQKNVGITRNFEQAIKECSGDIIFLSDQDDVWCDNKLLVMEKVFLEHPDCTTAFCNGRITNSRLELSEFDLWGNVDFNPQLVGKGKKYPSFYDLLLKQSVVTGMTMAFRRENVSNFFPLSDNWIHDGWIALIESQAGRVYPVNECLVLYRQHESNIIGAQTTSVFRLIKKYVNNKQAYKDRITRYNGYSDALAHIKDKNINISDQDRLNLEECVDFWKRKLDLAQSGFFKCFIEIVQDYLNKKYDRYYCGAKGAARDIVCLITRHYSN
jgi:Glycosyltransferases involved in cell wall biogenesis